MARFCDHELHDPGENTSSISPHLLVSALFEFSVAVVKLELSTGISRSLPFLGSRAYAVHVG